MTMNMASNTHSMKLKHSYFMGWLASKRESNHELKSRNDDNCPHKLKETCSIVIAEEDDSFLESKLESSDRQMSVLNFSLKNREP